METCFGATCTCAGWQPAQYGHPSDDCILSMVGFAKTHGDATIIYSSWLCRTTTGCNMPNHLGRSLRYKISASAWRVRPPLTGDNHVPPFQNCLSRFHTFWTLHLHERRVDSPKYQLIPRRSSDTPHWEKPSTIVKRPCSAQTKILVE